MRAKPNSILHATRASPPLLLLPLLFALLLLLLLLLLLGRPMLPLCCAVLWHCALSCCSSTAWLAAS